MDEVLALELVTINRSVKNSSEHFLEKEFSHLFRDELGCVKDFVYRIDIDKDAEGIVRPPRKVPLKLQSAVKERLDEMERRDVTMKVTEPTKFVSQLSVVEQKDKLRLCIDPTDLNKYIKRRHHPLKTFEDVSSQLAGSRYYRKFDCHKGFWQIKLAPESYKLTTFATPWGRYCFKRMPFGIKSAPEVYQQLMEDVMSGLENVIVSADDILVYSSDLKTLDLSTRRLLERLSSRGLKLNRKKCVFKPQTELIFLGHLITSGGVKPDPSKVDIIKQLKAPTSVEELRRFLGLVTYLSKFVKNFSDLTAPLRDLLKAKNEFLWSYEQQTAFESLIEAIRTDAKLRYYDINKPVTLQVDASSVAVGAALIQDGHPISFASRALTSSQQNYHQIEKECLAIVFGCTKYHEYVYGAQLTVETDHQPLEAIFKKPVSACPQRLQAMRLRIQDYNPRVVYIPGETMTYADLLSRDIGNLQPIDVDIRSVAISRLIITEQLEKLFDRAYESSHEMKLLRAVVFAGWPKELKMVDKSIQKYWNFRNEIGTEGKYLVKGTRIIIPDDNLRVKTDLLHKLHEGHTGINRTISKARETMFWPGIAKDISKLLASCEACKRAQNQNPKDSCSRYFRI